MREWTNNESRNHHADAEEKPHRTKNAHRENLGRAAERLGKDEHLGQRRVQRQLDHLAPQRRQRARIVERAQHPQLVPVRVRAETATRGGEGSENFKLEIKKL
jgi:hypothetical protein